MVVVLVAQMALVLTELHTLVLVAVVADNHPQLVDLADLVVLV